MPLLVLARCGAGLELEHQSALERVEVLVRGILVAVEVVVGVADHELHVLVEGVVGAERDGVEVTAADALGGGGIVLDEVVKCVFRRLLPRAG